MKTCYRNVRSSIFHKAKEWKQPKSINRWMDKQNVIYPYNRIFFNHNIERSSDSITWMSFFFFFKYLFIWLCWVLVETCGIFVVACGILSWGMWALSCGVWDIVPWPGIKPGPPALGAWSLSHWTTREVPVDEPWKKPATKDHVLFGSIYMKCAEEAK